MINPASVNCVLYHANCVDGCGAAYAAWKRLGDKAEYHAVHHGDDPPDVKGKNVAILDFAYDKGTTQYLTLSANELMIIDHHRSNMLELQGFCNAIFDMHKSGAALAWEFFHEDKPTPSFIKYIEDRDLWKWELPYSHEFSTGFEMVPLDFRLYDRFQDEAAVEGIIKLGHYILPYRNAVIKKLCKHAASKKMGEHSVLVLNTPYSMSEVGNELARNCDIAVVWYYDHFKKCIKISFRAINESVDVSTIAKKFGGGGHKSAAGCRLPSGMSIEELFDEITE
jgi:oligoribonuclease NrnB/cAMP/cGMP phosphodiesterase (DHH superfamily)